MADRNRLTLINCDQIIAIDLFGLQQKLQYQFWLQMWKNLSNYAMKLYLQQQPSPKILMGFDFGLKSTGVSVTSSDLRHAFYYKTIAKDMRSKQFRETLTKMLIKESPIALIIGKPSFVLESQQNQSIIEFIDQFIKIAHEEDPKIEGLSFTFVDESWTTLDAKMQLKAIKEEVKHWGHLHKQKQLLDGMAAINILRKYLDFFNKN